MDEQKDLSVSNEDVLDNNNSSVNDEVPNVEENADTSNGNDDVRKAGNGYRGLASSNREAFSRGLDNERIARNQANLNASRANAANSKKEVETDNGVEEKDKTGLDKLKDKRDVLRNKGELAASKIDKARAGMYAITNPTDAAKMLVKAKIRTWILASIVPITIGLMSIFVLFVGVFFVLGLFDFESQASGGRNQCHSLAFVESVCSSITVKGKGTMDIDEYIAGVINAEVGGLVDDGNEMFKAGAIAARSYVLANAKKDGSGNCIVESSQRFQVYKENPTENMMKAAKETSGIVLINNDRIYSSQYDAFCYDTKDGSNYYVCQGNGGTTAIPVSWVDSKVPSDYRAAPHTASHGNGMSQWGAYYLITEKGMNYIDVLEYFYGDDGAVLASLNGERSNHCTSSFNGNFQPLSKYNLNAKGLKKLNRVLTDDEKNYLNNYINSSVDRVGYGTGVGVATAGQSLAYGLEQYGYYLGYYWGGDCSSLGVGNNWGKNVGIRKTDSGKPTGPEFGVDCSGFVSWTIRNACKSSFGADVARGFVDYGKRINNINNAKPGDLLANSGHVILIVKNNGDGTLITVESTISNGVIFNEYNSTDVKDYKIVDMEDWYSNNCNLSR